MANALSTLFGEIATAIREKTGDSSTMKPSEFPANIRAITTGESPELDFVMTTGSFTPTSETGEITITHGLNKIPDIVFLMPDNATSTAGMRWIMGMSTEFARQCGVSSCQLGKLYLGSSVSGFDMEYGINESSVVQGFKGATDSIVVFTTGSYAWLKLHTTSEYTWFAFGGLVAH